MIISHEICFGKIVSPQGEGVTSVCIHTQSSEDVTSHYGLGYCIPTGRTDKFNLMYKYLTLILPLTGQKDVVAHHGYDSM